MDSQTTNITHFAIVVHFDVTIKALEHNEALTKDAIPAIARNRCYADDNSHDVVSIYFQYALGIKTKLPLISYAVPLLCFNIKQSTRTTAMYWLYAVKMTVLQILYRMRPGGPNSIQYL